MTYRKSDVQHHSEGYGEFRPAVNVKVYRSVYDVKLPLELGSSYPVGHPELRETDRTDPRFDHEWIEQHATELEWTWQASLESGWETLQLLAEDTFGEGVKVYGEGRSGGWCLVEGLPDFETWDAIMLRRWQRFERDAKVTADAIPEDMLQLAYDNVFEPWRERTDWFLRGC